MNPVPSSTSGSSQEYRMSGLSADDEDGGDDDDSEEPTTPKSSIPRKSIHDDTPPPPTEQYQDEILPVLMPPVQEYAVMTAPPSFFQSAATGVLRSPRPRPPRVKAVDWCPPSSLRGGIPTGGSGAMQGTVTTATPTVATSRAVRGDDATITTYATMTTMGDAASILEADSEEEESEDDDDAGGSGSHVDEEGEEEEEEEEEHSSSSQLLLASSVASGITDGAMPQIKGECDRSVLSYNTVNTFGMDLGSIWEESYNHGHDENLQGTKTTMRQVDKLPSMTSTPGTSVVSGTTSKALRDPDDPSIFSLNASTVADMVPYDYEMKSHVVDRTPSNAVSMISGATTQRSLFGDEDSEATFSTMNTTGRDRAFLSSGGGAVVDHVPQSEKDGSSISVRTDRAVRMREDQSVATWNTFTTAANATAGEVVVDAIPSSKNSIVSGTTNHAVLVNDDQSVATWNTMTTAGAGVNCYAVDRVPSLTNLADVSISGTTNRAIRAPDDQSLVTFATMTTFGGDRGNKMVDHVPSISEMMAFRSQSDNTNHALCNQSVQTWTTMNTLGNNQLTGNVVDRIPSFVLEENAASSALSAPTNFAVQGDRSVITFATTTTSGERGIQHVVDGIPTFAGGGGRSVTSGITNQAVRMSDDRSVASFNTITTFGDLGSIYERGKAYDEDAVDENRRVQLLSGTAEETTRDVSDEGDDDEIATSVSSSSRPMAPSGILREGRHNRQLVQRETAGGVSSPVSSSAVAGFNAGESVSNAHILRAITELRLHVDYRIEELDQRRRRDSERVIQIVQQEQVKRTALEARLHSQLLLQSESMVAMELKLLRLEAKVAHRELHRQRRQPGIGAMAVTDRLPPIAATSSPNRSDEEVDSFEELDLTPRANRQALVSSSFSHGGANRGPANIAVVTRSGASVASAVTATSFADGDFAHLHDGEERSEGSEDGDVGSESTPASNNRISNLESILLNPLTSTGSNDQGISTRATRGETDGMSSLPTSVTSATMASTVVTSTTRGESVGLMRMSSRASEEDMLPENVPEQNEVSGSATAGEQGRSVERSMNRFSSDEMIDIDGAQQDHSRSRSQSPLTVQSAAAETIGTQSVASVSVGPSILSTAAVASSRSFGTRRAHAAMAALERTAEGRPLANRVVSFTTNDMVEQFVPPQENDGGGDSITMPDELDTFSDIADAFSNSARAWREEYEARLDAIHKRLGN
ncbi:hypothetical protein ACHAW6_010262 [Cyclotella cf. meneghiniana]